MADQHSNEGSSTGNVSGESSDSFVELKIKTLDSQIFRFHVDKSTPVLLFREKIANEIGVPVGQQRLIFRGKVLKDEHLLSEYHVENGHSLHLVERQPAQSQPSSDTSSGETKGNNANRGNDAGAGIPRNRVGQISHSVVLWTFNVGDQGESIVPDLTRVIGAVLNSFGVGGQPTTNGINSTQSSTSAAQGNETDGAPSGGQNQAGNQTQSAQSFPGQTFQFSPQVIPVSLTPAAMPVPSLNSPIPDALNTLSEFMNHMEAHSPNGDSTKGDVENARINRSPSAYLFNPPEERARYPSNVDTTMTLLKFLDIESKNSIGAFSWFATHGTSMSRDKLISGDNKGAAARFFEHRFSFGNKSLSTPITRSSASPDISKLIKRAQMIKATGGKPCGKATSQGFKVRKNDGSGSVGAFCQSNVGYVPPNVLGAFCTDTGKPCDFNRFPCNGNDQLCVGRGPGYPDEILSTKIIGERQFQKAVELFTSAANQLSGKVDYRHAYLNFTNIEVELDEHSVVKTCPAALGPGFAAGTTDGPGAFGFQQSDTEINEMWKQLRDLLKEPSQYQVDCQKPKAVLLSTGEMFRPYAWAARPSFC